MDRYDQLCDLTDAMAPQAAQEFLTRLGEAGDAAAQCLLADAFDDGSFGVRDPVQSVAWYKRSADQGYDRAEYFLGSMTAHGIGTARGFNAAAYWFRRGAAKGDPQAQFRLAELLILKLATALPGEDGHALLDLAIAHGSASAAAFLTGLRDL